VFGGLLGADSVVKEKISLVQAVPSVAFTYQIILFVYGKGVIKLACLLPLISSVPDASLIYNPSIVQSIGTF